jgi:hypothetical protein
MHFWVFIMDAFYVFRMFLIISFLLQKVLIHTLLERLLGVELSGGR